MLHLHSYADIAVKYGVTRSAPASWARNNSSFPRPVATYGPSGRPLFNPNEVASWVRSHRPEYVQPAGEVR